MARFTHILVIFAAFALVACGKSEAPKTETTKTDKKETAATSPKKDAPKPADAKKDAPKTETAKAPAAGKNGLLGKWTLDVEGMKQFDEFKKLPPEQQKMALAMVSSMKMQIEFTDKTIKMNVNMMGQQKSEETPYSILKQDGDAYTIETSKKTKKPGADGKIAETEEKVTQTLTLKGEQLIIKEGNKTIALKRLGADAAAAAPAAAAPAAAAPAAAAPAAAAPAAAPAAAQKPAGATAAGWKKGADKAAGNKATAAGWKKGADNAAGKKATKAGWKKGTQQGK